MSRAIVVNMTDHFLQRWRQRVGAKPSLKGLNQMLRGALQIRRMERVYRFRGGRFVEYKLLAEFWSPESQIIVKVDVDTRTAVTVLSGKECCRKEWRGGGPVEADGEEWDRTD